MSKKINKSRPGKTQSISLKTLENLYKNKSAQEVQQDGLHNFVAAKYNFNTELMDGLTNDIGELKDKQLDKEQKQKLVDKYIPKLAEESRFIDNLTHCDNIDFANKDYYDLDKDEFSGAAQEMLDGISSFAYSSHDPNLYVANTIKKLAGINSAHELDREFQKDFEEVNKKQQQERPKDYARNRASYINLNNPELNFKNSEQVIFSEIVNDLDFSKNKDNAELEKENDSQTELDSTDEQRASEDKKSASGQNMATGENIGEEQALASSQENENVISRQAFEPTSLEEESESKSRSDSEISSISDVISVSEDSIGSNSSTEQISKTELSNNQKQKLSPIGDQAWMANFTKGLMTSSMSNSGAEENLIQSSKHNISIVSIDDKDYAVYSDNITDANKFMEYDGRPAYFGDFSTVIDLSEDPNKAKNQSNVDPASIELLYTDWGGEKSFALPEIDDKSENLESSIPKEHLDRINNEVILPQKLARTISTSMLGDDNERPERLSEAREFLTKIVDNNDMGSNIDKNNFQQIMKNHIDNKLKDNPNLYNDSPNIDTEEASYYLTKATLEKDSGYISNALNSLGGLKGKEAFKEKQLSPEEKVSKDLEEYTLSNFDKLKSQEFDGARDQLREGMKESLKPITTWYNSEKIDKEVDRFLNKSQELAIKADKPIYADKEEQSELRRPETIDGGPLGPKELSGVNKDKTKFQRFKYWLKKPIRSVMEKFTGKEKTLKENLSKIEKEYENSLYYGDNTREPGKTKNLSSSKKLSRELSDKSAGKSGSEANIEHKNSWKDKIKNKFSKNKTAEKSRER